MTENEEFRCFVETCLNEHAMNILKFCYENYVVPLQKEKEVLVERNKHQKHEITRLQNKMKGYSKPYLELENDRLRKLCVKLNEKNKQQKRTIEMLRNRSK